MKSLLAAVGVLVLSAPLYAALFLGVRPALLSVLSGWDSAILTVGTAWLSLQAVAVVGFVALGASRLREASR